MEERLEKYWKRAMSFRDKISDPELINLMVLLLSLNYKRPDIFEEMKKSLMLQIGNVNYVLNEAIARFCHEENIDLLLQSDIVGRVKDSGFEIYRLILDWEVLHMTEKEYDKAFDDLVEKINSLIGKFGAFGTSKTIRLLIQELTPKDSYSAMDLACGSGSLLADFLSRGGKHAYGQDISTASFNISSLRFLDKPNVRISLGDSLFNDLLGSQKTDVVFSNPPFNLKIDKEKLYLINQSFGEGLVRSSSINLAWIKLGLKCLNEGGTGIFVLPVSSLNNSYDHEIRKSLVESGQIQAIISLPGNMLLYSSIPVCVWVVKKTASPLQRDILLIDASNQVSNQGRNLTTIDKPVISDLGSLVESYRQGKALTNSSGLDFKVVSFEKIRKEEYYLQPSRYIEWVGSEEPNLLEYEELGNILSRPLTRVEGESQRDVKKISVQNLEGSLSQSSINLEELKIGGQRATSILSNNPVLLFARIGKKLKPTILSNYQSLAFDFVNVLVYELDTTQALYEYLIVELEKPYVLAQIDRLQSGSTTLPSIRRKDLESLRVNLPSLEEQKRVVDEEKQKLVRSAEKELQALAEKIGLERADANSFLRHKIAGPLRNLRGAFKNINMMLEKHVISQNPHLLDKKLNDKRTKTFKDYLQIFERDLEKVTKLINQSSNEYDIENKAMEEVELLSFIQNYLGDIEGTIKEVSFIYFIDKDILEEADIADIVILSNKELLRDLLDNLVRNAEMHSFKKFEGKKEIYFNVVPKVENSFNVHVNISNTGNPVGSSFDIDLFSKMGAKAGDSEGDGFGLWYVKEIMKKHNGELRFTDESRLENAIENTVVSTFELIFPIKELIKNYGEI